MRKLLIVSALLLVSGLHTACGGLYARGYAGFTQMGITGDVALAPSVGGVPLDAINNNIEDAFGIGEESSFYGRTDLGLGVVNFTASGFQYAGTGTGDLAFGFGDLPATTPIRSAVDLFNVKAAATLTLLNIGAFRLSPGIALDYFNLEMEIESRTAPLSESLEIQAPVPLLFAQAELDLGYVGAIVDAGWIEADVEDADGQVLDIEAMLRVMPTDHIELVAGYRYISLEASGLADDQDFSADVELQGWFVGGGITF